MLWFQGRYRKFRSGQSDLEGSVFIHLVVLGILKTYPCRKTDDSMWKCLPDRKREIDFFLMKSDVIIKR